MAYLEFKYDEEHYWLQDPIIYNRPGERLFLLRVGCHTVEMCIPYGKSMNWDNGAARVYVILRGLGLSKKILRINVGAGVYKEDCIFIKNNSSGKLRPALIFTIDVRLPMPRDLLHNTCAVVYHSELFGKNEKCYPELS